MSLWTRISGIHNARNRKWEILRKLRKQLQRSKGNVQLFWKRGNSRTQNLAWSIVNSETIPDIYTRFHTGKKGKDISSFI